MRFVVRMICPMVRMVGSCALICKSDAFILMRVFM